MNSKEKAAANLNATSSEIRGPRIRNWFNHEPLSTPRAVERPFGVSMTIPGQALTLRQVIDRFVRGIEVHVNDPVYLGEDEVFAGVERMSVLDRLDALMELNRGIAEQRGRMAARVAAADAAAAAAAQGAPTPPTDEEAMTPDKKSKASKKDADG